MLADIMARIFGLGRFPGTLEEVMHNATRGVNSPDAIPHSSPAKRIIPIQRPVQEINQPGNEQANVESTPATEPASCNTDTTPQTTSKPKKPKMKKWPEDKTKLVPYEKLVGPVKKIIDEAYKFTRTNANSFTYEGYTLGEEDKLARPYLIPKERFTEKSLKFEKDSLKRNLIDVALNVVFLLGVEQGRRSAFRQQASMESFVRTLDNYRDANKDLRLKIDHLEARLLAITTNPNISTQELEAFVSRSISLKREERINAAREELAKDVDKAKFGAPK